MSARKRRTSRCLGLACDKQVKIGNCRPRASRESFPPQYQPPPYRGGTQSATYLAARTSRWELPASPSVSRPDLSPLAGSPMTKLVSAGPGSFIVKRSGESFSTPPRAARSRLATADLKRLTSARSPLGNPAGVTFGQRVSAHRCSVPLFCSRRAHSPLGQNRRSIGTTSSTRSHRELPPLPTICIQPYFAVGAGLRGRQDLVGGGKRQEGGGW